MTTALHNFNNDLQQTVLLEASTEGREVTVDLAFTGHVIDVLVDAGEVDDAEVAAYNARGARVSAFEVSDDEGTLHLLVSDYRSDEDVQTLGRTDLETAFRRMSGFLEKSVNGLWRSLEESSAAWDMAHRIQSAWSDVGELRFTLLTNAELRTNVPPNSEILGRPVHFAVWDLARLYKLHSSGRTQEPIDVDIEALWGAPLPCLGPSGENGVYEAYLLMLPGEFLSLVYETYGPRLLELNVRSFLQSRGAVNRGIQTTILNEPTRFLAYNNGISMTASAISLTQLPTGGVGIRRIQDLQIVNGGQTTASLHYAKIQGKADLSQIQVQGKLSVVEPARLEELVPRISQFANSQNRVNMADFTSNDPFHVQLEKLSRTIWAPAGVGGQQMTRWFYERARGQYADAHARERTAARQREFKRVHPVGQKLTKTDVAKFENTWDQLPWIVALGAEKNFREFMLRLAKRGRFEPTQDYFESLVAKAIMFRSAERLIGRLNLGGYRAQTVTYTLAKLLHATAQRIDVRSIWRNQTISDALVADIQSLASRVHAKLLATAGTRNVSEWAKKEECWTTLVALDWDPSSALTSELVNSAQRTRTSSTTSITETLTTEEAADATLVTAVTPTAWFELSKWAKETDNLETWQRGIAFTLGRYAAAEPPRSPSRKQVAHAVRIISEARRLGFNPSDGSWAAKKTPARDA